MTSLLP